MAFDHSADVVLEVLRAADPARAAAATERLRAIASGDDSQPAAFAEVLDATQGAAASPPPPAASNAPTGPRIAAPRLEDRAAKAQTDLAAVMLGEFVGEMMPKDAASAFGQGLAGSMWKSMLAEQAARQIAASGALNFGKRLFATHALAASRAGEGGARAPAAAQASPNALSLPMKADVADGAFLFSTRKPT